MILLPPRSLGCLRLKMRCVTGLWHLGLLAIMLLVTPAFGSSSFTYSSLTLTSTATIKTNAQTTVAYEFEVNNTLAAQERIELVLPYFTIIQNGAVASSGGCAGIGFSIAKGPTQGTSSASVQLIAQAPLGPNIRQNTTLATQNPLFFLRLTHLLAGAP